MHFLEYRYSSPIDRVNCNLSDQNSPDSIRAGFVDQLLVTRLPERLNPPLQLIDDRRGMKTKV